jgi:hypothetical protein
MQLSPDTDELMARNTRMDDEGRDSSAASQQIFNHSTVRDNAKAHFGNSYYYGTVHQNSTPVAPLTGDTEHKITDKLKFDGMDMRRATVNLPSGNTCQWLFDSPAYKRWRDLSMLAEHHGFLWIRGKPGAGKSTLMKLAVKHADQEFSNDLRISFFFNAKGTFLEKSLEGMYRTLLYQLLVQCPELERVFHGRTLNPTTWSVELLEANFRDSVLQLESKQLTCHIDALDECEESDVRGLVEFFEGLGSMAVSAGVEMHICFASRHYPRISILKCVHLVLDKLKGHQQDIETYVRNNLKVAELALRDQLVKEIGARSHDIFLWVVLVVRLLNRESDRGNSHNLRAQLDAMPSGLHDLFENAMLERGTDDSRSLLPVLLWALFAAHPLTVSELYHAVLCARNDTVGGIVVDHTPDPSEIENFVLNTSKGLTEITAEGNKRPRVQFIHETVREYLLNNGIGRLESSFRNNSIGMSHDYLKSKCVEYMSLAASFVQRSDASATSEQSSRHWKAREDRQKYLVRRFPFLIYAIGLGVNIGGGVVTHVESAQAHGISQVSFLDAFPLDLVIKLGNLISPYRGDGYYPSASKTYILACFDAPRLLQLELDSVKGGGEHQSQVNAGVVSTAGIGAVLNSRQGIRGTPLHAALQQNRVSTIKLLLKYGSDVNARGEKGVTALMVAARYWIDLDIVELLFQCGADVTVRDDRGDTALHHAESVDMARLFLGHGADVNAQSGRSGSVLHAACLSGLLDIVKCLVEHGADVNSRPTEGGRGFPLQAARSRGHQEIVDYLLEQGARDDYGVRDEHGARVDHGARDDHGEPRIIRFGKASVGILVATLARILLNW